MGTTESNFDIDDVSIYLRFLLENQLTNSYAGLILYLTIVILAIIVYKLGFAKKLPILKSAVIYVFLLIGCFILYFLSWTLPIVGALFFAALVLVIYKSRLKMSQKNNEEKEA